MNDLFENNKSKEKIFTCRITDDELDFINELLNGKFSEYVHNCIKKDLKKHKQEQKTQLMKDFGLYLIMAGMGVLFFIFGSNTLNVLHLSLLYIVGFFLLAYGTVGGVFIALQSTRRK